ncbi:hypothetical protein GEV27_14755 [Aeromicrobium sp. S22]|uniref:hypothetical protein n=1 Tax=Aeromicrobium sp. S22 TaxID=2662029 RepID=UPI00129DA17F|nr:hypothetical protein [Aeromicrobium sp. S22]MRK02776.1 hypothetical protein [Aeromicrobium sp. S22]
MGWTLRTHGTAYDVVTGEGVREALLVADGVEVDRRSAGFWGRTRLTHEDSARFEVQWGPRNTIVAAHLLEEAESGPHRTPLVPPPGSRAAKREELARDHPRLFVAHRVGQALGQILLGTLGIGALVAAVFGALLPRVDLSWIPSPDLPDLPWPDLRWPELPGWLDAVLAEQKYWLPVVIALVVALRELDRRRVKDAERQAAEREAPVTAAPPPPPARRRGRTRRRAPRRP